MAGRAARLQERDGRRSLRKHQVRVESVRDRRGAPNVDGLDALQRALAYERDAMPLGAQVLGDPLPSRSALAQRTRAYAEPAHAQTLDDLSESLAAMRRD